MADSENTPAMPERNLTRRAVLAGGAAAAVAALLPMALPSPLEQHFELHLAGAEALGILPAIRQIDGMVVQFWWTFAKHNNWGAALPHVGPISEAANNPAMRTLLFEYMARTGRVGRS